MKRIFILSALVSMFFAGCSAFDEENSVPFVPATPDLQAGFADETRTYVENSKYLRWHEADLITAFYGNTLNRQYKFKGQTGDNSGTFSLVPSGELGTGNAFDRIYAVYPYNETATITDEGEISFTLPAVQNYAENSFGKGANTMIAVTENLEDTFLAFKNACGYLKLKLYGNNVTLANIEIKGNNDEKIAGAATATIAFGEAPQLKMADDATTIVTIDCGEGVTLGTTAETATELWVVLPETTFEGGITITATDNNGVVVEKSTINPVIITRNEIQPMAALEMRFTVPETWKIYYTAAPATSKVVPNKADDFGANIKSNEWNSTTGEGVIIFDGEVTSIGMSAFQNCDYLTSIIIPESVVTIKDNAFASCDMLEEITIPSSVTSMGTDAFSSCSNLQKTYIDNLAAWCNIDFSSTMANPLWEGGDLYVNDVLVNDLNIPSGVTIIKKYTFERANFTSVTIPDSVTEIGNYAFRSNIQLVDLTIGKGVKTIGEQAFRACNKLTTINIPGNVTTIGTWAFFQCTGCEYLYIGEGVKTIGEMAFQYLNITKVTIPASVNVMGGNAFALCSRLYEVYCKPQTPPTSTNSVGYWFSGAATSLRIYVPKESLDVYKNTPKWWEYSSNFVGYIY